MTIVSAIENHYVLGIYRNLLTNKVGWLPGQATTPSGRRRTSDELLRRATQAGSRNVRTPAPAPVTKAGREVLDAVKEKARHKSVKHHGRVTVPRHDSRAGVRVEPSEVLAACRHMGIGWPVVVTFRDEKDLPEGAVGTHSFASGAHLVELSEWSNLARARRTLLHELQHCLQEEQAGGRQAFRKAYRANKKHYEREAVETSRELVRKFPGVVFTR